ncbi:hypothetical protein AGMMS50268_02390 [Spirochaetia bacterium]|nr:hypothetical protein AGMMS49546_21000 [Spirochaetia bacterium]GHV89736.1 hypothetical protein AGMMS50268_02390 [Spirochaetia bacterium]
MSINPDTIPVARIDSAAIRHLVIHYRDYSGDWQGKSDRHQGIEFRHAILDHYPAGIEELTGTTFDIVSPCIFDFNETQRNKPFYFIMRWENPSGKKGPWSEIYSAIIP